MMFGLDEELGTMIDNTHGRPKGNQHEWIGNYGRNF